MEIHSRCSVVGCSLGVSRVGYKPGDSGSLEAAGVEPDQIVQLSIIKRYFIY